MDDLDGLLRGLVPVVLGVLVRRHGDFETCEDAVQEALLAAATQWSETDVPDNPAGWLITVASRRRIELLRGEVARRRRERTAALLEPPEPDAGRATAAEPHSGVDDTLILMLLCCHPLLSVPSQVALTLRAVGGLSTAEIARGFLVPEVTVGQRISRAKQKLRGARFELPGPAELPSRVSAVQRVLYLIFNEGYTASSGPSLYRADLTAEAIRLTRHLRARLPDDGETAGLLALMLLTEARRPSRTRADGALVPLADQDRNRWDAQLIGEGTDLLTRTLASAPIGPYQVQAAIAAVHDEAPRADGTDWAQILVLYDHLSVLAPGPMVTLNRIVAVAMVHGPDLALRQLQATLAAAPALAGHHRLHAIRAHLLDLAGDTAAARYLYRAAARMTLSLPEQRYLEARANRLSGVSGALGEAVPVTGVVPDDRFDAVRTIGRGLGEFDAAGGERRVVGLAVRGRHHARGERALRDQRPDLLRRLRVQHGMRRVDEQQFLAVAARRPHSQPAHAAVQLDVVGGREAELVGVELLGRVLVEYPDRDDRDAGDHADPMSVCLMVMLGP